MGWRHWVLLASAAALVAVVAPASAGTLLLDVHAPPPPPPVRLAVGSLRVELDGETGNLTSAAILTADATLLEFLAGRQHRQPLVTLTLTTPAALSSVLVRSCDFRNITIVSTPPLPGRVGTAAVRIEFSDHPNVNGTALPLSIAATVVANSSAGQLQFGLRVTNSGGSWAVQSATFPGMRQAPVIGPANDPGELLLPFGEGAVLDNPSGATITAASRTNSSRNFYPRDSFVQFTARSTAAAGLYLATEDGAGHVKRWLFSSKLREYVQMELQHWTGEVVARDFGIPYLTVLSAHGPDTASGRPRVDWRDAAAVYKRWATTQPWTARTLCERDDVPSTLLSGAAGVIVGLQDGTGYSGNATFGPQLERLPAYVARFKKRLRGTNVVLVPYGWEHHGTWAGIDYFPAVPSTPAWNAAAAALNRTGDAAMLLVSGFWWVVKRGKFGQGLPFDDSAELPGRRPMLVKAPPAGDTVWEQDFYAPDEAGQKQPWRGLSVTLCHGDRNATETIAGILAEANAVGVPLVSLDQTIGGGSNAPCYDPTHDHDPGWGSYMWKGLERTMQLARAAAAGDGRPLGLSMEQTSELAIQLSGTYWSRQFTVIDFPVFNARGIGLFSYLYHEYVTAMGAAVVQGQGLMGKQPDYLMRTTALANTLVRGLIAVPFAADVESNDTAWHRNCSAAFFSYAAVPKYFKEWLVFGATIPPPEIASRNLSTWLWRGEAANPFHYNTTVPAVVAGAFANRGGNQGIVLASVSPTAQSATVTLPPFNRLPPFAAAVVAAARPPRSPGGGRMYTDADTVVARQRPATGLVLYDGERRRVRQWAVPLPAKITILFEPYGVLFLAPTYGQ